MTIKGTIIIVTYCSRDIIGECLDSIKPLANQGLVKVVVVDNASTDKTPEYIQQNYPWVTLICNKWNGGFAYGNNQGYKQSIGEWSLFLNPDTQIINSAIETLVSYLFKNHNVGCVGPKIIKSNGEVECSTYPFQNILIASLNAIGLTKWFPINRINHRWCIKSHPYKNAVVDRLLGAAIMVKNSAFETVGGFDERFFLYSEEEDLCYRLKQNGWETHYLPQATILHRGGLSSRFNQPLSVASANWSRYLFCKKHYGAFVGEVVRWIWFVGIALRLIITICFYRGNKRNTIIKGYKLSLKSLFSKSYFEKHLRPSPSNDSDLKQVENPRR